MYIELRCSHNLREHPGGFFFYSSSFGGWSRGRYLLRRASLSWIMFFKIARRSRAVWQVKPSVRLSVKLPTVLWFSMVLCECYFWVQPLSLCLVCKLHSLPPALTEQPSQGMWRKNHKLRLRSEDCLIPSPTLCLVQDLADTPALWLLHWRLPTFYFYKQS